MSDGVSNTVLILDDEPEVLEVARRAIVRCGYRVECTHRPSRAIAALENQSFDILIQDIHLPEVHGVELLEKVRTSFPTIGVIAITGDPDPAIRDRCRALGTYEFLYKPIDLTQLVDAVHRTVRANSLRNRLERQNRRIRRLLDDPESAHRTVVGSAPAMRRAIETARKAAALARAPVLVSGPSGSGKELMARIIHESSPRHGEVFYPLNCSAIPEALIESELFGHTKGAFTGATDERMGVFEAADGGTLFLDEIGDMPLGAQASMLRVLEDQSVRRVGATTSRRVDVRIVAATNRPLEQMVGEGNFREDLYYRLNTIEIHVPPLRERRDDIEPLVYRFIERVSTDLKIPAKRPTEPALSALCNYDYPGNVRELRNMIERALILAEGEELTLDCFPAFNLSADGDGTSIDRVRVADDSRSERGGETEHRATKLRSNSVDDDDPIAEIVHVLRDRIRSSGGASLELAATVERVVIEEALRSAGFNRTLAARTLGISRQALLRRMSRLSIQVGETDRNG